MPEANERATTEETADAAQLPTLSADDLTPQEAARFRALLRTHFPALGTDEPMSGGDAIEELCRLCELLEGQAAPRWDGDWQLELRRDEQTATVREGEERGFLNNGWRVTGRSPRLTTDAQAARAAGLGWEVSAATGNFMHHTLRLPAFTPEDEAARALDAYRQETFVFGELSYSARRPE